jgi:hypothetical protein
MTRTLLRPRPWLTALLATGLAVAATATLAAPANAYTKFKKGDCTRITWKSQPRVLLHFTEFLASGASANDLTEMTIAVGDVFDAFNEAGATAAHVGTVAYESGAFHFGTWYNDKEPDDLDPATVEQPIPTIHLGFGNDPAVITAAGVTVRGPRSFYSTDPTKCFYTEAHIGFQDLSLMDWNFETPAEEGEKYYLEGDDVDTAGRRWFRPTLLHELIHSFGFEHENDDYSYMNFNAFPWAGGDRAETQAVRPLPDDVKGLRNLYPGTGSHTDVALLNTDIDPTFLLQGSAGQRLLCAPSQGTLFSSKLANRFAEHCGAGGSQVGSTEVCAGDLLYVRFNAVNYSTENMDFDLRLWFSTDDRYNATDTASVNSTLRSVTAESNNQMLVEFEVPTLPTLGTDYHPIIRTVASGASGAADTDWIPLTGTVHAKTSTQC